MTQTALHGPVWPVVAVTQEQNGVTFTLALQKSAREEFAVGVGVRCQGPYPAVPTFKRSHERAVRDAPSRHRLILGGGVDKAFGLADGEDGHRVGLEG
jgi:hypothetical protein